MMSNFAFLPEAFADIAESARWVEGHIMGDSRAACFHARFTPAKLPVSAKKMNYNGWSCAGRNRACSISPESRDAIVERYYTFPDNDFECVIGRRYSPDWRDEG